MKYSINNAIIFLFFGLSLSHALAQYNTPVNEKEKKRTENLEELLLSGSSKVEAFQDLGNVNFLLKNFEEASYWYGRLKAYEKLDSLIITLDIHNQQVYKNINSGNSKHIKGFTYVKDSIFSEDSRFSKLLKLRAFVGIESTYTPLENPDERLCWLAKKQLNSKKLDSSYKTHAHKAYGTLCGNPPSFSITKDGNTAYYSKQVDMKPLYGLFSRKEKLYKIYSAEFIEGRWQNAMEIPLAPKHFSAFHPSISEDGSRLFFASNMPGTYGKFDIYVVDFNSDGTMGKVMNLGPKVNTRKNELFPEVYSNDWLFFTSEGVGKQKGFERYVTKIYRRRVGESLLLDTASQELILSMLTAN